MDAGIRWSGRVCVLRCLPSGIITQSQFSSIMTSIGIYRKLLPAYSSERFYLLGEIEQICGELISLQADSSESASTEKSLCSAHINGANSTDGMDILYVLWKESSGRNELLHSIDVLWKSYDSRNRHGGDETSMGTRAVVVVEAMLIDKGKWTADFEADIGDLMKMILSKHNLDRVIFGVADAVAAPALEAVLDCASYHRQTNCDVRVFAQRREDFLGHDINIEPDAACDVFQILLSTSEFEAGNRNISSKRADGVSRYYFYCLIIACLAWVVYMLIH